MITGFVERAVPWDKEDIVIAGGGIIKAAMNRRGYKHRGTENQLTIRGEYARNLQYVYSKETMTSDGVVVDLVYFGVDVLGARESYRPPLFPLMIAASLRTEGVPSPKFT